MSQLIQREVKHSRQREMDCGDQRLWQGHCHNTTRHEKDIIWDSVATTWDVFTRIGGQDGLVDHCKATSAYPTLFLVVEIIQDNGNAFVFTMLPDTGSNKAVLAKDIAEKNGIKWDKTYDGTLNNVQGRRMNVSGLA